MYDSPSSRPDLEQHRGRVHLALGRRERRTPDPERAPGNPMRSCGRSRASRSARRPTRGPARPPSGSRSGCPNRPCPSCDSARPASLRCGTNSAVRILSSTGWSTRSRAGTPMPNEIRAVISRMISSTPPRSSRSARVSSVLDGLVAAADVIAHTRRRDVALVGDRAADRLAVARVMVGAQHAVVGVARVPCNARAA